MCFDAVTSAIGNWCDWHLPAGSYFFPIITFLTSKDVWQTVLPGITELTILKIVSLKELALYVFLVNAFLLKSLELFLRKTQQNIFSDEWHFWLSDFELNYRQLFSDSRFFIAVDPHCENCNGLSFTKLKSYVHTCNIKSN